MRRLRLPLALVLPALCLGPTTGRTEQGDPAIMHLVPRVREEAVGGRVEVSKPRERFVMVVVRALPRQRRRGRDAEAFVYLPQSTARQTVHDLVCIPPPRYLLTDRWGNQVAWFVLGKPKPGVSVHVCWMARVTLRELVTHLDESAPSPLPADVAEAHREYLSDSLRYVLTAGTVRRKAAEVTWGCPSLFDRAAAIHRYLAANLVYERVGGHDDAPTVLRRGTGSCSEKAFCWIALARANGIPARYTGALLCGADYPRFDTVHHRWTEIFVPRWGWLPVDRCADRFRTFRVPNDKLQLCWCGESDAPLNWNYVGRTVDATCEKFVSPVSGSIDFARLADLARRVFHAGTADAQHAVLEELERIRAPETIPLLQTLLYASAEGIVHQAAADIFALEPRAGRQVRSFVRRIPQAWETVCDVYAEKVDTFRTGRRVGRWVNLFNGRDLHGWTGDTAQFFVSDGTLRNLGPGTILSPYCTHRWYEVEMKFSFHGSGRVALVFAGMGDRQPNLQLPFRTAAYKKYNHLYGAASRVGAYFAEAGKRHTAHLLVADDRLWFALDAAPVLRVRNFAVAPGRVGIRTWKHDTTVSVTALRVRELARHGVDEAVARVNGNPA